MIPSFQNVSILRYLDDPVIVSGTPHTPTLCLRSRISLAVGFGRNVAEEVELFELGSRLLLLGIPNSPKGQSGTMLDAGTTSFESSECVLSILNLLSGFAMLGFLADSPEEKTSLLTAPVTGGLQRCEPLLREDFFPEGLIAGANFEIGFFGLGAVLAWIWEVVDPSYVFVRCEGSGDLAGTSWALQSGIAHGGIASSQGESTPQTFLEFPSQGVCQ